MTMGPAGTEFSALHDLAELGRQIEQSREPDPYPRPVGPAPSLGGLRSRAAEVEALVRRHGVDEVKIFGSVARGEAEPDSDLDVLVDLDRGAGLLQLAALQSELEDLLGCPVHVVTTSGLRYASESTRERIAHEAVSL